MGQPFGLRHILLVVIGFNLVTLCIYFKTAYDSHRLLGINDTLHYGPKTQIDHAEQTGYVENYENNVSMPDALLQVDNPERNDSGLKSTFRPQGVASWESNNTSEILRAQEKELLSLTQQLERSQDIIKRLQDAKDLIETHAEGLKGNYSILYSRAVSQLQTINYISQTMGEMNPYRKLGLYEKMPDEYYNFKDDGKLLKKVQYYAIKHNPGYCDAVDLYNLHNPENIFQNMNFITDYGDDEILIRESVMKQIGEDVMPGVSMGEKNHQEPRYDLEVNGTMMFFKKAVLHSIYEINKEWSCLSQMYNHIPGSGVIMRKDLLVQTINTYTQRYAKMPQCIQQDTFFPSAYRLNSTENIFESECRKFFDIINTPKYNQNKEEDPIQYLVKVDGAHRAMGVFLFDEQFEDQIRTSYKNGTECGTVQNQREYILQRYISNPLFLDKQNKFDFRMYMLVASVNPLIVYYHDGFLRVSLSKYDKSSKEKNVHFTNTHLSKDIFSKAEENNLYEGMTEQELREYQMWTLEDLQEYLLTTGKITDSNWLDNHLRPKFKQAYIHIARMAEDNFYKSSSVFEMYGLDFVIDENMDIWFIECNPSPQMVGTTERKTNFLVNMAKDLFEIQYAYLRSRMKRVFKFVNEMEIKASLGENLDYEKLRKDFDKININKLDEGFPISETNGFTLIMDKNIEGLQAYFGHLSPQCIDV